MTVSRMIARPLLASMFVVGGINALRNASDYAIKAKEVTDRLVPLAKRALPQAPIPEDPATLVRINAAVHIGAGAALATGHFPRLASATLAATMIPTTLAGHQFWNEPDPALKANHRVHFFKNLSMLGGLLLAAVDTEGRPGVAWRTRRAARDVRREAGHLKASARREAKLAAAQLR